MKVIKKITALVLLICLSVPSVSCGSSKDQKQDDNRQESRESQDGQKADDAEKGSEDSGASENNSEGSVEAENDQKEGEQMNYIPDHKLESDSLYVKKVENLPEDFIMGMDASAVIAEENSGVKYYNEAGEEQDVFQTLAEHGVTHIRVRVWNDPYDEEGHGFGGGNNDIDTAVEIGKRATSFGLKLIVDFHYSDFWADPAKQMCPRAWEGMEIEEKTEAAYQYTKDSLQKLKDAGVDVGMVQVGNETNGALAGEKIWFNIQYIMQAGAKATREIYPEALVAVHFANPEQVNNYQDYAKKLDYYQVDYDVFGSSYYPFWHGTLENLSEILTSISVQYGKKVMVLETSYAYTPEDTDFSGNTISDGTAGIAKPYPYTIQGQANSVRDVIDTLVNKTKNAIGVCYWEGTWITVGGNSYEENSALWEKYGSGWASSFASVYDPKDAGKYYGGCAVDNQALFDPDGKPLESLKIFNLVRYGNETELVPDALEETEITVDLNGTIELPETVNAIMNDDSRQPVPVTWNITEEDMQKMYTSGPHKYDITGDAGGREAVCHVNMIEYNFLQNDSFETGTLLGWVIHETGHADELYVEKKPSDSLSGDWHVHFWSSKPDSVEFDLEQKVQDLPSGKYKYAISVMGGDCGEQDVYAYVKIDGEVTGTCPVAFTYYNDWKQALIPDITYEEGQEIIVGLHVKCSGEGAGAWGKIDDAMLNSVSE